MFVSNQHLFALCSYANVLHPTGVVELKQLDEPNMNVSERTNVTFECSISVPNIIPIWEINGREHRVTDLPSDFTSNGTKLTFPAYNNTVTVLRCFFNTFSKGMSVEYSNMVPTHPSGMISMHNYTAY